MDDKPFIVDMESLHSESIQDGISEFNTAVIQDIKPFITGRTLEIGSGSGLISSIIAENNIPIHLSDADINNCNLLQTKFADTPSIKSIQHYDFQNVDLDENEPSIPRVFQTIILLNVSENGFPNQRTIDNAQKILKDLGHLIMIVPANVSIYTGLQEEPVTWQRYNNNRISKLISNQFEMIFIKFANVPKLSNSVAIKNYGLSALAVARRR